jgi:hypothetical protein
LNLVLLIAHACNEASRVPGESVRRKTLTLSGHDFLELSIQALSGNQAAFRISSVGPLGYLDHIILATAVVPEPASGWLVGLALALTAAARRQRVVLLRRRST